MSAMLCESIHLLVCRQGRGAAHLGSSDHLYCEVGRLSRLRFYFAGEQMNRWKSLVACFGSHLFMPMPEVIREDMAFLDRIHFYIPGWEMPKMKVDFLHQSLSG